MFFVIKFLELYTLICLGKFWFGPIMVKWIIGRYPLPTHCRIFFCSVLETMQLFHYLVRDRKQEVDIICLIISFLENVQQQKPQRNKKKTILENVQQQQKPQNKFVRPFFTSNPLFLLVDGVTFPKRPLTTPFSFSLKASVVTTTCALPARCLHWGIDLSSWK